jgi:hypothetical protein
MLNLANKLYMNLEKLEEAPAVGIYEPTASKHSEKPRVIERMQSGTSTDDVRCTCKDCHCEHCNLIGMGRNPGSLLCPCTQITRSTPEERTFAQRIKDATDAAKQAYKE